MTAVAKQKRSGYARDPHDFYVEPEWCVDLLIDHEPFYHSVMDPCCGSGTIPKCFERGTRKMFVYGSDAFRNPPGWGNWFIDCGDFLSDEWTEYAPMFDNIVMNPPYKRAEAFARKAISLVKCKVAMLVRLDFLASQKRHKLFSDHLPARVYVLSKRPSMPPGGVTVRAQNGQHDYCWIVWDSASKRPSTIHWIMPTPEKDTDHVK